MDLEFKVSKALKSNKLEDSLGWKPREERPREFVSIQFEVFEQNNRHYITLTFPKYLADKTRELLADALSK